MVLGGIDRTPTEDEKQDYKQLGKNTPKQKFLREVTKIEHKHTKDHTPFDGACARIDFADELEQIEKESERLYGYTREEDIQKLEFKDLEKYGNMDRFTLISDDEDVQMQNINGVRTAVKIGHTITYVCKRGHKIGVFIPETEYDIKQAKEKAGIKLNVEEEK